MKAINWLLLIPITVVLYCAAGNYKLMPEYKKVNFDKSILGIILPKEGIQILNRNDFITDSVNNTVEALYYNYFSSEFLKVIKNASYFKEIYLITDFNQKDLKSMNMEINKENTISILIPSSKSFCADSFGVLLIINNVLVQHDIRSKYNYIGGSFPNSYGGYLDKSISNYLTHWGCYAFWDNNKGKVISFGEFDNKINIESGITNETLRNIIRKSATSICDKTNFNKY
jgi:hypothetical protein